MSDSSDSKSNVSDSSATSGSSPPSGSSPTGSSPRSSPPLKFGVGEILKEESIKVYSCYLCNAFFFTKTRLALHQECERNLYLQSGLNVPQAPTSVEEIEWTHKDFDLSWHHLHWRNRIRRCSL